ncbi:MAG: YjbH domain-containing protein [Paracoccaceae bacterium]
MSRSARLSLLAWGAALVPVSAQEAPGLSHYGVPGYVEMPSAYALPDGTLALSVNDVAGDVRRGNLVFQITPRLTGVFRYSYFRDYNNTGSLYDRSFDLRYLILREDAEGWIPAVSVGLQDFGGTGVFGAEYLVASKQFGPSVTATAGLGWGRFGSYGSFRNPLSIISDKFDTRPGIKDITETGRVATDRFFRGDAALFFGLDWQVTERLRLSVEYSSDAMTEEVRRMGYDHRTPINVGAQYRFDHGGTLGIAILNGSAVALGYSMAVNLHDSPIPSGNEPAPPAVAPGSAEAAASWGPLPDQARKTRLEAALKDQGITLEGVRVDGDTATVSITNSRWPAAPQAYGRTARVLSAQLPASVTTFRMIGHVKGIPVTEVTVTRRDLEDLEYAPDGAWQSYVRAGISDAARVPDPRENRDASLSFKLRPYVSQALFDPDNPLRVDAGVELRGEWSPAPGFYLSGALRQKIAGNLDESSRESTSVLPHVRSDAWMYAKADGPVIPYLTAEYFWRPGDDLYGRLSFGLLERMYGGASGELLWAPPDSRLALGVEVNYARQRDYDGGFGFLDYDVVTGHASAYYDIGGGYLGQVDVGRYLAGDWGSTFTLTRRFGNGVEVGAFFTLTDVSFEDFGEGSFDKGIFLSLPMAWLTGQPTQAEGGLTIRPIQRDGGARLSVRNRLYDLTARDRQDRLSIDWGRFWR